jgi:UDP-N-acetylmuramoyl-L-alanyl-D-glutamate--2,6-diaminopimelate ligase
VSAPRVPRPVTVTSPTLGELAGLIGSVLTTGDPQTRPGGVTHDSSAVRPGDLFAALPGARTHGARFAAQAAAAGAVAALTDPAGAAAVADAGLAVLVSEAPRVVLGPLAAAVYGDPSTRLAVIGITGTNGKTTTAYLVEAGLRAAGLVTGLVGTVETRLGDDRMPAARTTPEAPDLQALLAIAVERGLGAVVMEVSSHALALERVTGIRFAVGAFTNLGSDHLDFHGDQESYFAAKARLFDGRSDREIVNVDDAAGRRLVRPGTVTVSAAGDPSAVWRAADAAADGFDQTFTALGPEGTSVSARVAMPGAYSVANALMAVAILDAAGVPATVAAAGVAAAGQVPGRMERVDGGAGDIDRAIIGVVDYAHDPGSVAVALAALRPVTTGRLICVLGCGGDRDPGKRPGMGAAAARGADLLVATDDNPRSEDPAAIRAAMLAGAAEVPAAQRGAVTEVAGRRAAIEAAVSHARAGDCVAVLGKGHEPGQEIGGVVHPFDDRMVLAEALRTRVGPVPAGEGRA